MEFCQTSLKSLGHSMIYQIHEKDFILDMAPSVFGKQRSLFAADDSGEFDAVIMNPPYFKLSKDSDHARVMEDVVHGQPNMYAFFLAVAAQMLRAGGELVAITPRSFCSGLYFRDFRQWFLERMALDHIHLFESRTDTFQKVLQESIITLSHRLGRRTGTVTITTSYGSSLQTSMEQQSLATKAVIDHTTGDYVIRIPTSSEDRAIVTEVESWPNRFIDLGLRISTGPVVAFRAREFLCGEPNGTETTPLFSPSNVRPFETICPLSHRKQQTWFRVCSESRRLLVPRQNYVLLRRFSAKEERRRLTASCLIGSQLVWPLLAFENHLNYVYHAERELTVEEVYGLAALFNSALLDRYFRTISGNTQVNATEVRTMRFPGLDTVVRIGKHVKDMPKFSSDSIERMVLQELGINDQLQNSLIERSLF